jgi:polysaccharide biosynthesis protein PslG
MRRPKFYLAAIACAALAIGAVAGCGSSSRKHIAQASRGVSGPLVGVMFDGPALGAGFVPQLAAAVASGAESLRVAVRWSDLQPYRTLTAVPSADRSQFQLVGSVPTRFAELDRIVGAAASRRVTVLPVVESTPAWDAAQPGNPASPPRSTAPYAAFLSALATRYGPQGTFWTAHPAVPRVPIGMWQIWNEPNFVRYWSVQPFAAGYVKLLAAARGALKAADPAAKIVLAGFADFSWQYLADVYRVPGARRLFDVAAIHPYTAKPAGVIEILQRARAVMDQAGDAGKPILATEITWPSSLGKAPPQFGVSTTESQQAKRLAQLMPMLNFNREKLGLSGFYWYTWMGDESPRAASYGFDYAGLVKSVSGRVTPKPVLTVFKQWALSIEGCRRKALADRCAS